MKTVVLFFGLLALVKGQSTEVIPCTFYNGLPLPINTQVEGCVTPPCVIVQGGSAAIQIVFRAPHTIRRLETRAAAFLLPIWPIDYDLEEYAVACNFLSNTYCPVLKDEVVQYSLRLAVDPSWPSITIPIELRMLDETASPIMCLRMNVAVTNSRSGGNFTLTLN